MMTVCKRVATKNRMRKNRAQGTGAPESQRSYLKKIAVMFVLAACVVASHAALSTHSFTDRADRGSHPGTITYNASSGKLMFDLSAISGATVYRAIFGPPRKYVSGGSYPYTIHSRTEIILKSKAGDTLQLMGPRYMTFDATAAVQQALAVGSRCTLTVASVGGMYSYGGMASLDVTCNQPADSVLAQVDSASARFENGDAMITFKEVDPPFTASNITCSEYLTYYNAHFSRDNDSADWSGKKQKIRYRIYRSTQPLTSENALINAELIDELFPMSGWDASYYGLGGCKVANDTKPVPRYPVDSLKLASPGTGIYVDGFRAAGNPMYYYFVSHAVDGAEDFSTLTSGVNATNGVTVSAGTGMVLLREVQSGVTFQNKANATLNYYVKWECLPNHTTPSEPYDYLVAVPDTVIPKPMAQVSLHCWGGSINSCYCGWFREEEGGLLISTNQYPYDWWIGYHENSGTFKPFTRGVVHPYTQIRYLSFLFDFAVPRYNIDTERIMVAGSSMGGSGASTWGLRSGHIFANIFSWVGVHIPRESPDFEKSYMSSWGDTSLHSIYSNEGLERFGYPVVYPSDSVNVWDYWDNTKFLAANVKTETPWMTYANGNNDHAIGWPQAWKNTNAMIATKRGFNFRWALQGHASVVNYIKIDYQKNKSYPCFTNGSLDQTPVITPGDAPDTGSINLSVRWDPATNVDNPSQWEMTMWLASSAAQLTQTVDVTPRRLQQLMHGAGSTYTWDLVEGATTVASGNAIADSNGLITIPGLTLSKTQRTLKIYCTNCTAGDDIAATGIGVPELRVTPNPFNPRTTIKVSIQHAVSGKNAIIEIYNVHGTLVQQLCATSSQLSTGIVWDASNQPSGMYIVKVLAGKKALVKKAVLVK